MSYPQIPIDLGFGEEHELLQQSARRFLAERCPMAEVRRLAEDPLGFDPALWKEIAALGWVGLVLPEESGGAGLGHLHLALLMEEMGRRLLPSPFLATLLAGFALQAGGGTEQQRSLGPALASGETIASVALCEAGAGWNPQAVTATAEPTAAGFLLRGAKPFVPAGTNAQLVIAPFREPGGELALFAVPLPDPAVRVEPEIGVDPTRRSARLVFDGARVPRAARLAGDARAALRAVELRGAAALAAEMVGGAESVLAMTRDYAIARKQFGRQIGAFQAVKHPIVDMMVGVELARSHALAAGAALDHEPAGAEVAARMAKALASDVFAVAVRKCVQLHGGFGFTWDCDAHFFFKRALWSRAMFGDAAHHRARLAAQLLDRT